MNVPIPRPRVAIVGSREATPQGIEDADLITRILVDKGVTIVSGLAKGIDAAAHKAAIRAGAVASALHHAEVYAPWTDGFAVLVGHNPGDLVQVS